MPKLIQPQLREAEFKRTIWTATPQAGTVKDEIIKPEFWVHVANKLKIGDRVEVSPESGEWLAEVIVRATGDGGPAVHILHFHSFAAAELPSGSDYEVKYAGASAKWRVIRKADRHVLVDGLQTREAAENWLANNSKTDLV